MPILVCLGTHLSFMSSVQGKTELPGMPVPIRNYHSTSISYNKSFRSLGNEERGLGKVL